MYIQRSRCQKGFFSKTTAHPLKKKKEDENNLQEEGKSCCTADLPLTCYPLVEKLAPWCE